MIVYADRNKLAEFVTEIPDNADVLLRYASVLVAAATRHDRYDVDPAGKPSDPFTIGAFEDAVCLQAAEWDAAGIDPTAGAGGFKPTVKRTSIAGGSVEYDTGGANSDSAARHATSVTTLCGAAVQALRNEGLGTGLVWSV